MEFSTVCIGLALYGIEIPVFFEMDLFPITEKDLFNPSPDAGSLFLNLLT